MTYINYYGWTRQHSSQRLILTPQYGIVLSEDLLSRISVQGDRIVAFFTNFITTPELFGPFPYIYHTHITEYLLEIFVSELFSLLIEHSSQLLICQILPFTLSIHHYLFNPDWTFQVVMSAGMDTRAGSLDECSRYGEGDYYFTHWKNGDLRSSEEFLDVNTTPWISSSSFV